MRIYVQSGDRRFFVGDTKDGVPVPVVGGFVTKHEIIYKIDGHPNINLDTNTVVVGGEQYHTSQLASAVLEYCKYLANEGEWTLYDVVTGKAKLAGFKTSQQAFADFVVEKKILRTWTVDEVWKILKGIGEDLEILYSYYNIMKA